ncbi:hypothetical protein EDF46_3458 [Frondihabitans sp. PhB188]|uniref:hypothetical protein n=1 Tax=Frondihabitans sp. PhB188 TaxID=2485200 RepID=UPI000F99947F|nr:hypothetical protein [Frondihabitans sp. PhB188]ROQ30946.1 hypothetical protein EDF46_3458 [Frondihabitans sp. PhB188]
MMTILTQTHTRAAAAPNLAVSRVRLDAFPARPVNRWLLRLLFALPFAVLAIIENISPGLTSGTTVNQDLVARVARIDWGRADVSWVGSLYPPIGTVLTALIPGGTLGLGIAGAVVAGPFLKQMLEVMHQRRFHAWKSATFMIALAANPLFAFTATTNFEAFLGIAFFGIGAANMVRFVANRNTQAGFRAGLLFMISALSSASGIVYIAVIGLTAPLITLARRGQRGARASNILVILFPTLATFFTVFFLQLVFLHRPFAVLSAQFHYDPSRWAIVPAFVTTLNGFLLLAPMISGWALALLVRRPGAILISTFLFLGLLMGYVFDLIPLNAAGNTFLIMTMMGIAILPAATTTRASVLITLVAGAQIVIAWAAAYNRPVVLDWMGSLTKALGWS